MIKSIYHLPNILSLAISPSFESLKAVDSIVKDMDKGYPGKEGFINWNNKTKYEDKVPLISYHVPDLSAPHTKGCYAISIFLEKEAYLILMKQHPLFNKVEKKCFGAFSMTT